MRLAGLNRCAGSLRSGILILLLGGPAGGQAASGLDSLRLELARAVFLHFDGVNNLSGLAISDDGWVYVVDDHGPDPPDWMEDNPILLKARLASITDGTATSVPLERVDPPDKHFDFAAPAEKFGKRNKYDLEGVTVIGKDSLWAVDERDRLLLAFDLATGGICRLAGPEILLKGQDDLMGAGLNTAFEGVARLGQRLFIAWEMRPSAILVYRLDQGLRFEKRIRVENSLDLNDLCVDRGYLYALGRTNSEVYKIDPESGRTLAVANFKVYADSSIYRYRNREDFFNSEGLALTRKYILVVLDGNMQPIVASGELDPLLFVFRRPAGF